jgi:Fur family ferric uptake transcriptional regulator
MVTGIQRMTPQRKVILQKLKSVTSHPSAEEIYQMVKQELPRISLGTVYRNLEKLAQHGLIIKLGEHGKAARFDADTKNHFHIRCTLCGEINDLRIDSPVSNEKDINKVSGYKLQGYKLEYFGVCSGCNSKRLNNSTEEGGEQK